MNYANVLEVLLELFEGAIEEINSVDDVILDIRGREGISVVERRGYPG